MHATDRIGPCKDTARMPRRKERAPRPKCTKARPPTVDAEYRRSDGYKDDNGGFVFTLMTYTFSVIVL